MNDQKDFFEKVADVASDVADSIARTATDLYQQGKTQMELSRLRAELREHYRKLGAIVYALERHEQADNGSREMIMAKLDDLRSKIYEVELAREAERQAKASEKAAERGAREATRTSRNTGPIEVRFDAECCGACGEARVGTLPFCAHCGEKFKEA